MSDHSQSGLSSLPERRSRGEASVFTYNKPFRLESGALLNEYHLAYTTLGELNDAKDNAVWIFHALTDNSDPSEWWSGLVGDGKLFDPAKHFIVCVNMPGSAYGSLGPLDINPLSNEPYYHEFPWFTTKDMIRAYDPLRKFLGIEKIHLGIGGSMGGQQLLEWAIEEPQLFEHIVPIATNAFHSAWGIAFNASQRLAIEADQTWKNKTENAGSAGLIAARSIALLSYRHYDAYGISQIEEAESKVAILQAENDCAIDLNHSLQEGRNYRRRLHRQISTVVLAFIKKPEINIPLKFSIYFSRWVDVGNCRQYLHHKWG